MSNRTKLILALIVSSTFIILAGLYIWSYTSQWPLWEAAVTELPIAVKVKEGTLSFSDLFAQVNGHRWVFSNLIVVASTYFADWNPVAEAFSTLILLTLNFTLLINVFHILKPTLTWIAAIPFAALTFALRQDAELLVGLHTMTMFPVTFLLIALLALVSESREWWRPLIAGVSILCGAVSHLSGLALILLVIAVTWLLGYRRIQDYVFVVGFAVLSIAVMIQAGSQVTEVKPLIIIRNGLRTLGSPLIHSTTSTFRDGLPNYLGDVQLSFWIGLIGMLLFVLNALYLYRKPEVQRSAIIWATFAGLGVGAAAMIAIGRTDSRLAAIFDLGEAYTLQFWYASLVTPFWIGLVALLIIAVDQLRHQAESKWCFVSTGINVVVGIAFTVLYARANILSYQTTAADHGHGLILVRQNEAEDCLLNFPLTRDSSCFPERWSRHNRLYLLANGIDMMAEYGLGLFSRQSAINMLPDSSPRFVVIEGNYVYTRLVEKWLLDGINPDFVIRLVPQHSIPAIGDETVLITDESPENLAKFQAALGDQPEFWDIFEQGTKAIGPWFMDRSCDHPSLEVFDSPVETLVVMRYRCLEEVHPSNILFGNAIHLQGWELSSPVDLPACQAVNVNSAWLVDETLPQDARNYSLTVVLVNSDGMGVAHTDAPPAGIRMNRTLPSWTYIDRRALTIPCDLAAGDYSLMIGIYHYPPFKLLPMTISGGEPSPTLYYLTTLHVHSGN